MGSPYNEEERDAEERTHDVTLSTNYRMMTTEVTQSLYKKYWQTQANRGTGDDPNRRSKARNKSKLE